MQQNIFPWGMSGKESAGFLIGQGNFSVSRPLTIFLRENLPANTTYTHRFKNCKLGDSFMRVKKRFLVSASWMKKSLLNRSYFRQSAGRDLADGMC